MENQNMTDFMTQKITNRAGIDLIKTFEGCRLSVYLDMAGLPTVGYGHMNKNMLIGTHITQDVADQLLKNDLTLFETGVNTLVKSNINENQFSALVCFSFNLGLGNLVSSSLLKFVNKEMYEQAANEFPRWNKVNGLEVEGLTQRRLSEQKLFRTPTLT